MEPPGCGKTYLARKLAQKISYDFLEVKASTVGSPYIHQTTTGINKMFEEAAAKSPIILFLDEIDSMAPERDSLAGSSYRVEEVKVVNEAARTAILEDSPQITFRHLDSAVTAVPSSLPAPPKGPPRKIGFFESKKK